MVLMLAGCREMIEFSVVMRFCFFTKWDVSEVFRLSLGSCFMGIYLMPIARFPFAVILFG